MKNEYHKNYNIKRYHKLRKQYIEDLGGKCIDCGSKDELEFHHTDPNTKSFEISKLLNYSQSLVKEELKKCVLKCKVHHMKETSKQLGVEHGGGKSGKKNCPCLLCKAKKAEYMKNYKKK